MNARRIGDDEGESERMMWKFAFFRQCVLRDLGRSLM
jgi:hypothetical protein